MVVSKFAMKTVNLVPDLMVMREKTDLTMFVIKKWELVYTEEDNHKMGIKMEIVLKRKLTNEIMTTFLPTVLLIFITFITMFFHQGVFKYYISVFSLIPDPPPNSI